ncbi:MAG: large subunit ribosomal protein L23 [Parcubacteria group bacterium Gr01-1014_46]|nr:MAG: large subunit ribosomal protein L23 [Parcubacteria group bacterium Gr01-1014_46]
MKKDLNSIILRPHITEKATVSTEHSVYVFEVANDSTKSLIKKSFEDKYKISPLKISTVTIPAKNVFVRGKRGKKSGYKKAYVYLAKGQKLES